MKTWSFWVPAVMLCMVVFSKGVFAEGWARHKFDDLSFSISCPADWDMRKLPAGEGEDLVAIILPKKAASQGFKSNIVITSSAIKAAAMTLDSIYQLNIDSMSRSDEFPKFKQENSYKIKLGNLDAYQTAFTYSHPKLGVKLKSFQIYAVKSGRLFIIQYAAALSAYKKYMDEVNEIVRSFEPF